MFNPNEYEYWTRALAGDFLPVHDGFPQSGFYRRRMKGRPDEPVAIWSNADGVFAMSAGEVVDADDVWTWVCRAPITEEVYRAVVAGGEPWPDAIEEMIGRSNAPVATPRDRTMTITYHRDFEQGSGDWLAQRCGMLTASEVQYILTPTLKNASNEKERQHLYEMLAQRISKHVEPQYVSDAMLRGENEEIWARDKYAENYAPVEVVGLITNDKFGFTMGYSPDGIVGDDGLIEVKSRSQKFHVQTICENVLPIEFSLQIQSGLLISERKWCDFISYSGGLPMFVLRVMPDPAVQTAIVDAACAFEARLADKLAIYATNVKPFHPTERRDHEDIIL